MVFGKTVKVLVSEKDRDRRSVGEVFIDGMSLNVEIINAGFAWRDPRFSKSLGIAALQEKAKLEKRGLWIDKNPVPPWEFRKKDNLTPFRP